MDRQRILMIFGIAWLSAALLSWFVYAKTQGPKTEKMVKVVAAARDMPAGTRLKKADVKLVSVPEKDLPRLALLDERVAQDRVLLFPINANEPVSTNKLASAGGAEGLPATIEPGKRAVSVAVADSSGAAGLITPRSRVDVLFTRGGSMNEALTTVVLEDVVVLSIGRLTEVQPMQGAPAASQQSSSRQQAVTLLVTPEEAARLEFCKNQGKISLALRNPLDRGTLEDDTPVTAADLHPALMGLRRPRGGPGLAIPNLKDDKFWAQLTGIEPTPTPTPKKEEPPKPRFIIDVYRGDKHVQEIFQ